MSDVTQIIARIESGDRAVSDELLPLVYQELRRLAEAKLAQAAKALEISTTTVENDWAYARSWLRLEMSGDGRG